MRYTLPGHIGKFSYDVLCGIRKPAILYFQYNKAAPVRTPLFLSERLFLIRFAIYMFCRTGQNDVKNKVTKRNTPGINILPPA